MNPTVIQYYREAVLKTIQATVQQIFEQSQANCPVVSGTLKASGGITASNPAAGEFTVSYNINDTAPYMQLVEEGGVVPSHNRTNRRTGKTYGVNGYTVQGKFFIKQSIQDVFSGQYNLLINNANVGSSGYNVNL